jgi:ketosteroid isomerase-like protein
VFSGPIEDRLSIRERFDSYSDSVTRQALDDYLDCWTDDAARFGDGGECQGIEGLRAHWHGIWKMLSQMVFMTQIGSIVVDGATATTRSYCLETFQLRDGTTRQLIGAYDDELRRVDGVWRFSVRRYRVLVDNAAEKRHG